MAALTKDSAYMKVIDRIFENIVGKKYYLTSIDQRKSLLAEAAVDILTQIIESDERDEFAHRLIRPALIRRSSCASIVD